jgi:20S proteasome subunit alpha 2
MSEGAYSFSLTTFSPSGKLVQIEYALNAVAAGSTSLGIRGACPAAPSARAPRVRARDRAAERSIAGLRCARGALRGRAAKNGVVIATEKKAPTILIDETSLQKICMLTDSIGAVYSGMGQRSAARRAPRRAAAASARWAGTPQRSGSARRSRAAPTRPFPRRLAGPDFRVLVAKGRKAAQAYFRIYREEIPLLQLVRELAAVMQEFTQSGGVRPFGISLLLAGFDHSGPHLYQIDPSGSFIAWKANAIGKNFVNAKSFLEKRCVARGRDGGVRARAALRVCVRGSDARFARAGPRALPAATLRAPPRASP